MFRALIAFFAAVVVAAVPRTDALQTAATGQPLKVGIIGLDTSHVPAFTKILNNPKSDVKLQGFKVVAAYPAGSPDVAVSRDRVDGFTKQLKDSYGVEMVASIEDLVKKVDVILLESVDGRPHLEQARAVIRAGKPLFIDKPMAASLVDVVKIFALAKEHKVPCFSSSTMRFSPEVVALKNNPKVGNILGADVFAPGTQEEHHPDLMWYGVHAVEMLYALMGTGCETVVRTSTKGGDVVTGVWKGGRIGSYRGIREGKAEYGATLFGSKAVARSNASGPYEPLLAEICKFFRTGQPPVSAEETIEMFAFMEAADESKRQGGTPVALASVLARAKAGK
jgi:Oxidoreductase family, NAD-binding Rossmann fold